MFDQAGSYPTQTHAVATAWLTFAVQGQARRRRAISRFDVLKINL